MNFRLGYPYWKHVDLGYQLIPDLCDTAREIWIDVSDGFIVAGEGHDYNISKTYTTHSARYLLTILCPDSGITINNISKMQGTSLFRLQTTLCIMSHMLGKYLEGGTNNFKKPINISRFPCISQ